MTTKKHRSRHSPPANLPTEGGSYTRTEDGALVRNAEPDTDAAPATADAPTTTPAADSPRAKRK